ncbi:bifunctional 5,10-methylenetetrahydrofolate dehydrogenase/5,10-methenyltetrahydrofolate cyclohydrolase [Marinilactibacillus psychrotolerans]|uniref:Bifunctional protein FolD n=1 Tax=Marinilactibacillus psychrotolerans TaxID=191770 RepID=A0A5R9C1W5_9LACT|nr:bifunctional 5,10-methylenetetrahydrofolate dehydrogenase/5,10-methenyltetrahydrofolate cyclohydrolase [Marinilactibacillus psychrotolerans]TLQ06713.1 bifunctional 5,10-methylenetetrahydrofolate dehydrogenase/5,10-methenyltetrahydrofolate cyclohydrolase [Marinilactibacillus psychrotolerans]GEQ32383.1 bifunctional 5,10-methylene-tetrahydrofolate dehydrogenase / 5,10-methylene-tetrahydrofolate cyclohydrolase [Marinilactibacillus psychrotolerans]
MVKVLQGKPVAEKLNKQTEQVVQDLKSIQCTPALAIVRIGDDDSSIAYESAAIKVMNQVGIEVSSLTFSTDTAHDAIFSAIDELNEDQNIHGILVMQPLPEGISRNEIAERIDPEKDIDGLTPSNLGKLVENNLTGLWPSTPKAVMELLEFYNIELKGADVCVIGSSPIVGKPLTILLLNAKATVSNCHVHTKDLKMYTRKADIVISATGSVHLITPEHIKEEAIVIDVGYGEHDGEICGDVQYDKVEQKAAAITPVPGGVGPITTAVLAEQVVKAAWTFVTERKNN